MSNLCASRPLFINDLSTDVNDWGVSHTHFHQTKMVRSLKSKPDQMLNQGQRLHIMNWGDFFVLFQYPLPPNDPNSSHCVWWKFLQVTAFTGNDQTFKLLVNACDETRILQVRDKSQNLWLWMGGVRKVRLRCRRKRRFQVLLQSYWNYIVIWCRWD